MTETPASDTPSQPSAGDDAPAASNPIADAVRPGYAFEGTALELGGLMLDADTLSDVHIRIPLGMLNRHGLVAGATGTGKTVTLQVLAEQLSDAGVPVFLADIKGDLSGVSVAGEGGRRSAPGPPASARSGRPRRSPPSSTRSAARASGCRCA